MPIRFDDEAPVNPSKRRIVFDDEVPAPTPGIGEQLWNASRAANPVKIAQKTMEYADKGLSYLGEKTAEGLASRGVDPRLSAAAGTAAYMAPDLATAAFGPAMKAAGKIPALENASRNLAQRALGFTKRHLNTPSARRKAASAAEVALEQGVINGSPDVMARRADALANKAGEKLGKIRDSVEAQDIKPITDALESLKARKLYGAAGGMWNEVSGRIKDAIATVRGTVAKGTIPPTEAQTIKTGLLDGYGAEISKEIAATPGFTPPAKVGRLEDAKKLIADTVNWLADNPGKQQQTKAIVGTIEGGVEDILRNAGVDMVDYQAAKKTFGAAKAMQMGLNNELAAQAGNQIFGLKPVLAAGSALASGNPIAAAASLGFFEAASRRGTGLGAKALRGISRSERPSLGRPAASVGLGFGRREKGR
jgi:hypothetical protein